MQNSQEKRNRSRLERLARWWRNWTVNRFGRSELNRLGADEIRNLAQDIGASSSELRALAGKWPDSANLLECRMTALHLDADEIKRSQPAVTRDLQKLCSLCGKKQRCEHDLDNRAVKPGWRRYCPNSTTLMALVAERHAKQSAPEKP